MGRSARIWMGFCQRRTSNAKQYVYMSRSVIVVGLELLGGGGGWFYVGEEGTGVTKCVYCRMRHLQPVTYLRATASQSG